KDKTEPAATRLCTAIAGAPLTWRLRCCDLLLSSDPHSRRCWERHGRVPPARVAAQHARHGGADLLQAPPRGGAALRAERADQQPLPHCPLQRNRGGACFAVLGYWIESENQRAHAESPARHARDRRGGGGCDVEGAA